MKTEIHYCIELQPCDLGASRGENSRSISDLQPEIEKEGRRLKGFWGVAKGPSISWVAKSIHKGNWKFKMQAVNWVVAELQGTKTVARLRTRMGLVTAQLHLIDPCKGDLFCSVDDSPVRISVMLADALFASWMADT